MRPIADPSPAGTRHVEKARERPVAFSRRQGARAVQRGFTLIEAVMVITISGILMAVVAIFILPAFTAYMLGSTRAQLVDNADNALRRISSEMSYALPNSVRVAAAGTSRVLEFIPTSAAAQYANAGADPLQFGVADSSFAIVGPALLLSQATQPLAFYNLGPGNPGADAYTQANLRFANNGAAGTATSITLTSNAALPALLNAPPYRVYAVSQPVTFRCDTSTGTLVRYTGYGFVANQPNPPVGGQSAVLARGVNSCSFLYEPAVVAARTGMMTMSLSLSGGSGASADTVSLYQAVHVSNVP